MIFRQQLFRISNTVSVQSKFFAIAHDDFAEAQLLHVSAVKDRLDGGSEEGRVILYLREQIDSGGGYFYGAAVLQGDDDIPAFFFGVEDVRFVRRLVRNERYNNLPIFQFIRMSYEK